MSEMTSRIVPMEMDCIPIQTRSLGIAKQVVIQECAGPLWYVGDTLCKTADEVRAALREALPGVMRAPGPSKRKRAKKPPGNPPESGVPQ